MCYGVTTYDKNLLFLFTLSFHMKPGNIKLKLSSKHLMTEKSEIKNDCITTQKQFSFYYQDGCLYKESYVLIYICKVHSQLNASKMIMIKENTKNINAIKYLVYMQKIELAK